MIRIRRFGPKSGSETKIIPNSFQASHVCLRYLPSWQCRQLRPDPVRRPRPLQPIRRRHSPRNRAPRAPDQKTIQQNTPFTTFIKLNLRAVDRYIGMHRSGKSIQL